MFLTWLRRRLWQPSLSRFRYHPALTHKFARPRLEPLEGRLLLSVYAVINTNDSGEGSLRQAILDANAHTSEANTIIFDIRGQGPQTIRPLSALPTITNPVTIDATFQPGYAGTPLIELDGSQAGSDAAGLEISAGNSVVRGLDIDRFGYTGIILERVGGDRIESDFIGTDVTGTQAFGNRIGLLVSSSGNTIGGTEARAGNLISGNRSEGVDVFGANNLVQGNLIGTDVTGSKALGNVTGVFVLTGNTIGGTASGAGNVISGNTTGILATSGATIQGNLIGTDVTGTAALSNLVGVFLEGVSNTVGGTASGAGNVISGNTSDGVEIINGSNVVQGNLIGTDITGSKSLANANGVHISQASNNTIGGTASGARNVISGNIDSGVVIDLFQGQTGNVVEGNYIGTDIKGTTIVANSRYGIQLQTGDTESTTLIGGTTPGAGNVISGNGFGGIHIISGGSSTVQGNYIGTDATGTLALGNGGDGVSAGSRTTIGGTAAGAGNLISGNAGNGIFLAGDGSVQGNLIGTDVTGTQALGNGGDGVSASGNVTIGGTAAGAGNLISGNTRNGIFLSGSGNLVRGNSIGTDITGTQALGNGTGVYIVGSFNTIGGTTTTAANVIAANGGSGVLLSGVNAQSNLIEGNFIGTDTSETLNLGNAANGVTIQNASNNTIGGTAAGAGNTIAFNGNDGVLVDTGAGNAILSDLIFANGNLGIELINNGNHNRAAPLLTGAFLDGPNTVIQGVLQSTPNTTFTVQLFSDPSVDPSGFAEGQQLLGTVTVTTDAFGFAAFTVTIPTVVPAGQVVTATATDAGNNTSEFSSPVVVTAA